MNFIYMGISLVALVSCGNPHLNLSQKKLEKLTPSLSSQDLNVRNPDGGNDLSVVTSANSINSSLNVKNPNSEEIVVTYAFEKGDHFRFNGGNFPGTYGSCSSNQLPSANCNLDIEFFATAPGVYVDNLVVTYSLKSNPGLKTTKAISLRGEKLSDNLSPIILSPMDGGSEMDFKTAGTPFSSELNQKNPNNEDVIVSYKFEKGSNFRFKGGNFPGTSGNCSAEQLPDANCKMEIEFFADEPGRYTDNLTATYALKSIPSQTKEVKMPLVGEIVAPLPSSLSVKLIGGGSSFNFGSQPVNLSVRTDQILLENTGKTDQYLDVKLIGGQPFRMNNHCPAVLIPAATCTIDVHYVSTDVGTHNDIIRVTHHKPSGSDSVIDFPVTGTTVASPLTPGKLVLGTAEAGNIDYGTILSGTESRKLVEISNIGQMPVILKSQGINGDSFIFSGGSYPGSRGTCGQIILPGSCSLDLAFLPSAPGTFNGGVLIVPTEGSALNIAIKGKAKNHDGNNCFKIEERQVLARSSNSAAGISFPYLRSARGTKSTLEVLYGTTTNARIPNLNRYTVKDAMVFVTFDIPEIPEEIVGMDVNLDVTKVVQDGFKDTESLCLSASGIKKCSGRRFTLASWKKLNNPNFWDEYSTPVTTTYEDEFSKNASGCGTYTCFYLEKRLSANEIFHLSAPELRALGNNSVNLIFSDDTRLRTIPSLIVRVKKPVSCQ